MTEHLTDGWEPDLPVADTLLRQFVLNPRPAGGTGPLREGWPRSRPGAEALGFLPICRFTLWHRPRSSGVTS